MPAMRIQSEPRLPEPRLRLRLPPQAASVHTRVAAAICVLGFVFLLGVLRAG